jgi:hypothetical protein
MKEDHKSIGFLKKSGKAVQLGVNMFSGKPRKGPGKA